MGKKAGVILPLACAALLGCGSSSNFNQLWGKEDNGGDSLLLEAQAAYDRGEFDKAIAKTEKMLDVNPDNEDAAVLLGYATLSNGGIDPYKLARALIKVSDKSTSSSTDKAKAALADSTSSSSSSSTSSVLTTLAEIINLTDDDFTSLTDSSSSVSKDGIFADAPIIVPAKVTDALREKVEVLKNMNKSIKAVCRFVDPSVLTEDARDKATDCAQTTAPRRQSAKAHFLWAFSHLTEVLVYQTVLLYQTAGSSKSNFEVAAAKVTSQSVTDAASISSFVDDVSEFNSAVSAIFDTTSEDSMMRATLLSLTAVNLAFAEIAGLPDSMKSQITSMITKIETLGSSFGGGTEAKTKALKGQLTEKFNKEVSAKISTAITNSLGSQTVSSYSDLEAKHASGAIDDTAFSNITSMCSSYSNLSSGLDPDAKTTDNKTLSKPSACP